MIYIDRTIKTPYYLQIYEQIQNDILLERLKPGDYLTGSRILSRELGVGRNTVDNAYAQLAAEGYIESKKGKGFAVLDITEWKPISISRVPANTKFYDAKSEEAFIYDLSYGNYSCKYFPAALWKRYTNDALTDENISDINYYQDRQGNPMLRKRLVEYLRQSRGVLCNESQILITGGLQHSLELVCKLFNGTVAIEEPGYDCAG
ncbi:MAG: GntR family transcriptional regulator [Lachnospiraceae bacterium]